MSKVTAEIGKLNAVGKGAGDLSLPDRGTGTGLNGDTYGADLSVDATNAMGGMGKDTGSHPAFEECPPGMNGAC